MRTSAKLVTFIPLVAFAFIVIDLANPPWPAYRWLGLVLVVIGMVGVTVARLTLRDSFSVSPQARELITTGIYSKVRHPIYVFSSMAVGGLLLYIRMPWLCLLLIPLIVVQIMRAKAEEKVLTEKFGDAYLRYKQGTWC